MRRAVVAYSIAFSYSPLVKVQTRASFSRLPIQPEDGWVDVGGNKGVHRHRKVILHLLSPLRLRLENLGVLCVGVAVEGDAWRSCSRSTIVVRGIEIHQDEVGIEPCGVALSFELGFEGG